MGSLCQEEAEEEEKEKKRTAIAEFSGKAPEFIEISHSCEGVRIDSEEWNAEASRSEGIHFLGISSWINSNMTILPLIRAELLSFVLGVLGFKVGSSENK